MRKSPSTHGEPVTTFSTYRTSGERSEDALAQLIDRYCAVWSESSASRRAELLDQVWAHDATYTDPTIHAATPAELLAHIESVLARRPGARVVRTSIVDVALPDGLDIAELSSDGGRIRRIVGFFGPLRGHVST
jgi:hypothetical protein